MRSIESLLAEYDESHGNPVNKTLHWICVPLIMFSLLGLLWYLRVPLPEAAPAVLNGAVILIAFAMIYYVLLAPRLAAGVLAVSIIMLAVLYFLDQSALSLWKLSAVVFILAWVGQFIGHRIEGRKPSFLKDIRFLLVGPLWLLAFVYRRFNIAF